MPSGSKFHFVIAVVLAVAFVVRLGAGLWWQSRLDESQRFSFGDSESYWALGRAIAKGEPYRYGIDNSRVFRTPGYPILLAPLFWIADEPPIWWARCQAAFFSTASVGVMCWLSMRLFGPQTAILAGVVAAVIPDTVALGIFVLSEAPFCPFMMLQILFWDMGWRSELPSRMSVWAFLGGCAAGIATLIRPSWLLFTPFAIGVGFCLGPQRVRQVLLGCVMMVGLCCSMSPWWIRNYQVVGRFVPTSLQFGASLYDGLSPEATGASDMQFVPKFFQEQVQADAALDSPPGDLFEERLDRRLMNASIQWAVQHPDRVAQLAIDKFFRLWSPVPRAAEFRSTALRAAVCLTFLPTMILAIAGLVRFARRDWTYVLCSIPAVYFTLLHMVFVSSIRYRQPAMLTLLVLAAGCVANESQKTKPGDRLRLATQPTH